MLIAVWIVSGLLALAYLFSAGAKILLSHDKIVESASWATGWAPGRVKALGVIEILGAVGMIVPPLVGIVPVLAPIAAVGLVLYQVAAIIVHLRHHDDPKGLLPNFLLLLAALFVAVVRFAGV
jgi:DoxX-like family